MVNNNNSTELEETIPRKRNVFQSGYHMVGERVLYRTKDNGYLNEGHIREISELYTIMGCSSPIEPRNVFNYNIPLPFVDMKYRLGDRIYASSLGYKAWDAAKVVGILYNKNAYIVDFDTETPRRQQIDADWVKGLIKDEKCVQGRDPPEQEVVFKQESLAEMLPSEEYSMSESDESYSSDESYTIPQGTTINIIRPRKVVFKTPQTCEIRRNPSRNCRYTLKYEE
jgi:hypothetical protein